MAVSVSDICDNTKLAREMSLLGEFSWHDDLWRKTKMTRDKKGRKNAGYTLDNLSWRVETKCACPALNFIYNFFCFVRQLRDCQCVLSGGGSTNTQVIIILVCFRLVKNVSSGVRSHREMFFNSTISCHFCRLVFRELPVRYLPFYSRFFCCFWLTILVIFF